MINQTFFSDYINGSQWNGALAQILICNKIVTTHFDWSKDFLQMSYGSDLTKNDISFVFICFQKENKIELIYDGMSLSTMNAGRQRKDDQK